MYEVYKAKSILNVHKHCDGGWFWSKYSASPYTGCEYGCTYCYAREAKYNPYKTQSQSTLVPMQDEFSEHIKIKQNASELLLKQLSKQPKDLIDLDSHQPVDAKYGFARKMLEECYDLGFPVFVNEKSPLLLRDIDVLEKISKATYLNVGWSIIGTKEDTVKAAFEPESPPFEARFQAMQKLSERGIYTGTVFMPILPFIYDTEDHIEKVVKKTRESGGKYVLEGGLSLMNQCKTFFYKALSAYDSSLIPKYDELYSNSKLMAEELARIHKLVLENCQEQGLTPYIPRPITIYPKEQQTNRKIAEKFYLEARELQFSGADNFRVWAYRKAAWALDDLDRKVEDIYHEKGLEGLKAISGVGESLAKKIVAFIVGTKSAI
jgi:DNA repair photolyase